MNFSIYNFIDLYVKLNLNDVKFVFNEIKKKDFICKNNMKWYKMLDVFLSMFRYE